MEDQYPVEIDHGITRATLTPRRRLFVLAGVAVAAVLAWWALVPPRAFPVGAVIEIPEGVSLRRAGTILRDAHVVRSSVLFEMYVILQRGERGINAGEYFFETRESPWRVARRVTEGAYGFEQVALTIPEGLTRAEVGALVAKKGAFPFFDEGAFFAVTEGEEGLLFPDTYFVPQNIQAAQLRDIMRATFDTKIASRADAIAASGHTEREIVTMASIIEAEARTSEDRRIVSGILWKRITIGMPLQVDAAFLAVNGKQTPELTLEDLKIDSPYNTYTNRGLPPGPIVSPGLDAIDAALDPTESPYLYYLSDSDGAMHYAKTFEEHKENKRRYLSS